MPNQTPGTGPKRAQNPLRNLRAPFALTEMLGLLAVLMLMAADLQAETPIGTPPQRLHRPPDTDNTQCSRIAFDGQGILWCILNAEAVAQFDGLRWREIQSLQGRIAQNLQYRAQERRMYFAGFRDIGYLEPDASGDWAYHDIRPRLPEAARDLTLLVTLLWDAADRCYVNNLNYMVRLDGGTAGRVWRPEGIISHSFSHQGHVYLSTLQEGLIRIEGEEMHRVPMENRGNSTVTASCDLPDGRTVLAFENGTLRLLDGTLITALPISPNALKSKEFIQGLALLPNGWMAASTSQSVILVLDTKGNLHLRIDREQGLRIDAGSLPAVDNQGFLWMGTHTGLLQLDVLSPLSVLDARHGLGFAADRAVMAGGRLWVANSQGLWGSIEQQTAGQRAFSQVGSVAQVTSNMVVDHRERLLFTATLVDGEATSPITLMALDPNSRRHQTTGLTMESSEVLYLSPRERNLLFVTGYGSLQRLRLKGEQWELEGPPIPSPMRLHDLIEDPQEAAYWLTTGLDSVGRLTFGPDGLAQWERFTLSDGLPRDWITPRRLQREVIFCTKVGIYRFDPELRQFKPHPFFQELPPEISAEFLQIQPDERGNLWIGSREGTGVMRRQTDGSYQWDLLGLRLLGKPAITNILFEDPEVVWFITRDRVVRYDDNVRVRPQTRFRTLLREVREIGSHRLLYGGADLGGTPHLELPHAQNDIRVQVAANAFEDPQRNEFSHRLAGKEPHWSPWTPEATRDFTNLREGHYILELRSRNLLGVEGDTTRLKITIRPPWYRTWWAYGLYALGLAGGTALVSQVRGRYLKRKNRELERLVEEGTERIRHQADELSAANAHMARSNEELRETNEELATTNQQLSLANQRLEVLDQEKNDFIGIVSHDLRNPLGAIGQATELIAEDPAVEGQTRELVDLVQLSVNTSLSIVTNLLDLNRIEQGRLVAELSQQDLTAITRRESDTFRARALAKSIDLILIAPDPVYCQADAGILGQVIGNLISNAVKYSPPGRRVWVSCRQLDGKARCEVRDEGHGIKAEELPLLFRKFSRLSSRPTGGEHSVGLGLAIVHRMVEAMQGRIWCESIYGMGATFIVELPGNPAAQNQP